jgi:hypothetical protein
LGELPQVILPEAVAIPADSFDNMRTLTPDDVEDRVPRRIDGFVDGLCRELLIFVGENKEL